MSGFAVAYNAARRTDTEKMIRRIRHRGGAVSGRAEVWRVSMAQTYLAAEVAPSGLSGPACRVPVQAPGLSDTFICYDGRIGNRARLARSEGMGEVPFMDERLLLRLYEKHGRGMFAFLTDAVFSFVLSDGNHLLAARDLLGIKPLYYGMENGSLYLASELKAVLAVTGNAFEFPPGHWMDGGGHLAAFAVLPAEPDTYSADAVETVTTEIRDILRRSLRHRVNFRVKIGCLLSGGVDSSIIACLSASECHKQVSPGKRLETFALGVGESQDILNARRIADDIQSHHHELIVSPEKVCDVIPEVIYYLESFDPSLVRSAAANFLISKYAAEEGVEVLLSGEGGDELFCGYNHLKEIPLDELYENQMACLRLVHNNASLRLDRMNVCNGICVVAPFISGELMAYTRCIPPEYKVRCVSGKQVEKWILRKAFEGLLPDEIAWRPKQEFSQGAGTADCLPGHIERHISGGDLREAQDRFPMIRSKEELYYFRIFTAHFGEGNAVQTVGQWNG